jgi:hypothetical protein
MAGQTLYLDGNGANGPLAVLVEGPALRIRAAGRADLFSPLPRLARIVSRGAVHWRIEALDACLQWGVPISFLNLKGQAIGACVPLHRPSWKSDLPVLLEAAAEQPGWRERLSDWLSGMERAQMLRLARRHRLRPKDWRPASLAALCEARCSPGPLPAGEIAAMLDGLHQAEIVALFSRHGVGPRFLAGPTGGAELVAGFARVLRWALWPVVWRLSAYLAAHGAKHDRAALRRRIVRHYEAEQPRLEKERAALVARLATHIAAETS